MKHYSNGALLSMPIILMRPFMLPCADDIPFNCGFTNRIALDTLQYRSIMGGSSSIDDAE